LKEAQDSKSDAHRFDQLKTAVDALLAKSDEHPSGDEMQNQVASWVASSLSKLEEMQRLQPNLKMRNPGPYPMGFSSLWEQIKRELTEHATRSQDFLASNHKLKKAVQADILGLRAKLQEGVVAQEDPVAERLLADIYSLQKDVATLEHDLQRVDVPKLVSDGATMGAQAHWESLHKNLQTWKSNVGKEDSFANGAAMASKVHIEPHVEPQKWDSGPMCAAGSHYDTVVYAFANPWSSWNLEAVDYASKQCTSQGRQPTEQGLQHRQQQILVCKS
jgi:hypothetical protein